MEFYIKAMRRQRRVVDGIRRWIGEGFEGPITYLIVSEKPRVLNTCIIVENRGSVRLESAL